MKALFTILLMAMGLGAFAQQAGGYKAPEFPGGLPALEKYLSQTVKYPESARLKGVEGKVLVGFLVGQKGEVKKINIIRGVHPLLDSEAVRVVRKMPRWKPASNEGGRIEGPVALPINFKLTHNGK